jgi:hypothetical protein
MNILRAILSGIITWTLIFITFMILSFIPVVKDSEVQQYMLFYITLIPILLVGTRFYYQKENSLNGLLLGSIMAIVSLALDALITVPYVIIPHGGSYASFFTSPFMLITAVEFILVTYLIWKSKFQTHA